MSVAMFTVGAVMTNSDVTVVEAAIKGAFDLRQSINFGFGHQVPSEDAVMRLAFCVDGYHDQVAVSVRQREPGLLHFGVVSQGDPRLAVAQAQRVLSVDHDSTGYDELVAADPALRRVVARRPGLRPPLFYSAYEALLWAVLSARRPAQQMRVVRDDLARQHGRTFEIDGVAISAMPTPDQLLAVTSFPGVPEQKLRRMHAIADAAKVGDLDTETLRAGDPSLIGERLRQFEGIGPFYSELVTVRALGLTDVLPSSEKRVLGATAELLGRAELSLEEFAAVAEGWRPWRTWVCVAIRAALGG
jgi:DNA-3-methyladenine glycosylase II